MRSFFILFFAVVTLSSCVMDYGKHVKLKNVTIYYKSPVRSQIASKLAEYWIQNNYAGSKPQYLQLEQLDNKLILKLIPSDTSFLSEIPYQTKLSLLQLEDQLNKNVFVENNISIYLSNNQFDKITSIKD